MEKKHALIVGAGVILVIGAYFLLLYQKQCFDDACFSEAAQDCQASIYRKITNGNVFKYQIHRSFGGSCTLTITAEQFNENTPQEIRGLFEGKSMECSIPKEEFSAEFLKIGNTLDYCTGPLKEAMYELILQRMYDLAVKQIGDVVLEIETALGK